MATKDKRLKAHLDSIKTMSKVFTKTSEQFNEIVKEGALLAHDGYDINQVVNAVLELAGVMKGLNRRSLVTWYTRAIPYTFDQKEKRFTRKDQNKAKKAEDMLVFIANTNWFDDLQGTDDLKPYVINPDTLVNMFKSRIEKSNDTNPEFHGLKAVEVLNNLKSAVNSMLDIEIKGFEAQAHKDLVKSQSELSLVEDQEKALLAELESDAQVQQAVATAS